MTIFGKTAFRILAKMCSPCKHQKRPFTVCIEGNIGSGKTTFVDNFKKCNNTMVLEEPVELWRNVNGHNLLELMYKDPRRYSFLFQSYVQLTMLKLHTLETDLHFKVMERSVYSAMCFIETMRRRKLLEEPEIVVLEEWYNWSVRNARIETDLIVYLRTSPEVVYERMRRRAREEEDCVSLEYLEQVHEVHDEWLYKQTLFEVPAPVITLDGNQSLDDMLREFESCKEKIFASRINTDRICTSNNSPRTPKKIARLALDSVN